MAVVQDSQSRKVNGHGHVLSAVELRSFEKTGAIHAAFGKLASKQNLNVNVLVFLVMAFMSIGGAAGVFANAVVALDPDRNHPCNKLRV